MTNFQTPTKTSYCHATQNTIQREGDWICYNCNNLNFSFRKRCNRCKNQTREQNQYYAEYYRMGQICYNSHSTQGTPTSHAYAYQNQNKTYEKQHQILLSPLQNQPLYFQQPPQTTKRSLNLNIEYEQIDIGYIDDTNWNIFLNYDEQNCSSDSSGQYIQQTTQLLDYQIQQMVIRIII